MWAVGARQGLELTLSEGIISGLRAAEKQEIAAGPAEAKDAGHDGAAIAAVAGQPTTVDQLCARGRDELMAGHTAEALASFGAALAKDPESPPAWFGTGLVQVRRNDSTGALKTYERLKGLDPNLARELLDFIRDPRGQLTTPASEIARDELDRLQIVGKAAFGDTLSVNITNGTSWNLTAISVQVVGREGVYELVCTAREGIPPQATGILRTAIAPPGGWGRANWVIVGARGFKR